MKKIRLILRLIEFIFFRIIFSTYLDIKSFILNQIYLNKEYKIISNNEKISEGKIAIFAIYCPNIFYSNILSTAKILKDNNYKVIFVHCGKFKFNTEIFKQNGHILIERQKYGMDFVSFKAGFDYIKKESINAEKILFLNDSVFYLKNFRKNFEILDYLDHDYICLNEVFKVHHHFSSFFFIVRKKLFQKKEFVNFFDNININLNRRSFIKETEVKLSSVVKKITNKIFVYYSIEYLINNFKFYKKSLSDNLYELEDTHSVHNFNLEGLKENKYFYLKKDLIYKRIENLKNLLYVFKNNDIFCSEQEKNEIELFYKINGRFTKSFYQKLKNNGYL